MERWKLNLYILGFSQFFAMMSMNFGVPFIPYFIQELGDFTPERIKVYTAMSAALPALGMGLTAPFWGMLADRHGKKLMLLRAVFMAGVVFLGLGLSGSITHLLTFRFLQGVFTGTISASSAFAASETPDDQLSYSFGMLTSSRFLGIMVGPALGGFIAEGFGFRTSFMIGGGLMFLNGALIYFFLKESKKPIKDPGKKTAGFFTQARSVFTKGVPFLLFMLFSLMLTRALFSPYMALYVQEIRGGIEGSSKVTGMISAFIAMMTAISGIVSGKISSRFRIVDVIRHSLTLAVVMSLLLVMGGNLYIFALLYGFMMLFLGGVEPGLLSLASERVPGEARGSLFGFVSMLSSMGWAVSSVIGSIVSIRISTEAVLYVIPVMLVLMTVVITARRREYA